MCGEDLYNEVYSLKIYGFLENTIFVSGDRIGVKKLFKFLILMLCCLM